MDWQEIRTVLGYLFYDQVLFKIQDVPITLSHLAVALTAVVVSLVISRWIRAVLKRRVFGRFPLDPGLEFALLRITHYLILVFGCYIALVTISIPMGALVAFFTLLGVGIGFGLQNLAANFISGIILLFERPVKIGDRITVDDVWGDVIRINLRTTVVNTPDNVDIIIPNSKLLENNLINWSYGDKRIRIHVPVGVAYGSDVDRVTRLLAQAAAEAEDVMDKPEPWVAFKEFGDSSLNFELICWLQNSVVKPRVIDRLNRTVDRLFRENHIEIPFPQRDLHVRSRDLSLTP